MIVLEEHSEGFTCEQIRRLTQQLDALVLDGIHPFRVTQVESASTHLIFVQIRGGRTTVLELARCQECTPTTSSFDESIALLQQSLPGLDKSITDIERASFLISKEMHMSFAQCCRVEVSLAGVKKAVEVCQGIFQKHLFSLPDTLLKKRHQLSVLLYHIIGTIDEMNLIPEEVRVQRKRFVQQLASISNSLREIVDTIGLEVGKPQDDFEGNLPNPTYVVGALKHEDTGLWQVWLTRNEAYTYLAAHPNPHTAEAMVEILRRGIARRSFDPRGMRPLFDFLGGQSRGDPLPLPAPGTAWIFREKELFLKELEESGEAL